MNILILLCVSLFKLKMELIKPFCDTEIYVKEVYEKIAEHFNDKRFSQWDWIEHFLDTFEKKL